MDNQSSAIKVNALNPEAINSPILDDTIDDEYQSVISQESTCCYYNNASYADGSYISTGDGELFHCRKGVWVRESN